MRSRRTSVDRFWPKVDKLDPCGCWIWKGGLNQGGYGRLQRDDGSKKLVLSHRFSFELHHGAIAEGMCVCHRCDRPACVNPDHLFLGTIADNNLDMQAKGRNQVPGYAGEKHPMAKLTAEDVLQIRQRLATRESRNKIAADYGISPNYLQLIKSRVTWRSV